MEHENEYIVNRYIFKLTCSNGQEEMYSVDTLDSTLAWERAAISAIEICGTLDTHLVKIEYVREYAL